MLTSQIALDRERPEGLGRQLYVQIKSLIEEGMLASGNRLPTSRLLAKDLSVGRNTVLNAYEQLMLEGYLETDGRRGTRVSRASRGFERASAHEADVAKSGAPRLSKQAMALASVDRGGDLRNFAFPTGLPDVRSFPHDLWGRMVRRSARQLQMVPEHGGYDHYSGWPGLKGAILGHIRVSRGVVAEAERVVILSSAQACLDLVCRLLVDPGDQVVMEEPGYLGMVAASRGVGAVCEALPVQNGWQFDALSVAGCSKLIYVTPSHQFPTGQLMSLSERLGLLELARLQGSFILEDDYDSEFQFNGAPLACLQGLDRHQSVIYMGTFSKSLLPSLHVAYLVLPQSLVEPAKAMLRNVGSVPSLVVQMALADFLAHGYFVSHLREMNKLYRKRRDRLKEALEQYCANDLLPVMGDGGMQCAVYLSDAVLSRGWSDQLLVDRMRGLGLDCSSLSRLHWSGQGEVRQGLFLGYSAPTGEEIDVGVRKISTCLQQVPNEDCP